MKIFFYSKLTILAYLFFILFLILVGLYVIFISDYFKIFSKYSILFGSILIGGIGGSYLTLTRGVLGWVELTVISLWLGLFLLNPYLL